MSVTRSRAAKVDLQVGTGKARADLKNFARNAKRDLGDIGAGSYHGKGVFQSRGAMWKDRGARAARWAGGHARTGARVAGGVAMAGAAAGAMGLLSAADDTYKLEQALTRFGIATDKTPEQVAGFRKELARVSRETGLNRQVLLDGAAAYVALTGDAAGAAAGMSLFGKVANATGATMEDIAATAAAMKDNLKIDPKDFEAAFSALHVQGKAGAVELRELATQLAGLAPSFANFKNGSGTTGLIEMGAALQVVRKGFGTSAEAATGMRAMMVALQRNADKFRKVGVRIYDKDPKTGKKRLRDFSDIVDSIGKSKLAKDPTLLTKAFGSDEAKRAYDQLIKNRALFDDLIKQGGDKGAIDRDANTYLESDAGRIGKAWEAVKLKMAEAFTPERIERFAAMLEKSVLFAVKLIDMLEQIIAMGDIGDTSERTDKALDAGYSGREALHVGQVVTSPGVSQARENILSGVQPLNQQDMLSSLYGADRARNAQAQLQLQEIAKRQLMGGQSLDEATRSVTGGDQALTRALAVMKQIQTTPIIVKIGADTVVKAGANAPAQRTRAGGL